MSKRNGDVPFYEDPGSYKKCGIMSLAGCALMVAAAFLYWMNLYINNGEKIYEGVSLFSAAKRGFLSMFSTDLNGKIVETIFSFKAILPGILFLLYIAVLVVLIMAGIKDNFQRRPFLMKWRKRTRVILLLITVAIVIGITFTPAFRGSVEEFKSLASTWEGFIEKSVRAKAPGSEHMKSIYFIGPGIPCYIIGVVLYFISIVYNFILDTLNEEDDD